MVLDIDVVYEDFDHMDWNRSLVKETVQPGEHFLLCCRAYPKRGLGCLATFTAAAHSAYYSVGTLC